VPAGDTRAPCSRVLGTNLEKTSNCRRRHWVAGNGPPCRALVGRALLTSRRIAGLSEESSEASCEMASSPSLVGPATQDFCIEEASRLILVAFQTLS
jgi:hypothetical protein